jgi:hypothetical protein
MSRTSTLPKRLQPMLATLTDAPFDDPDWVFEDKYDGFRMIAEIRRGKVALYSRNGKIISQSYVKVARALEGVKADAVIDGELVAIGKDGVSHFQRRLNSERTRAALAAKKASGATLGNPSNLAVAGRAGRAVLCQIADQFASDFAPVLATMRAEGVSTLRSIAAELNRRGFKSARGGKWYPSSVANLVARAS